MAKDPTWDELNRHYAHALEIIAQQRQQLDQANSTRDAAQAEATRLTLLNRELAADPERLVVAQLLSHWSRSRCLSRRVSGGIVFIRRQG